MGDLGFLDVIFIFIDYEILEEDNIIGCFLCLVCCLEVDLIVEFFDVFVESWRFKFDKCRKSYGIFYDLDWILLVMI